MAVSGRPTGSADLPLHGGRVPQWLASRMSALGRVIVEAIVLEYGRDELLRRLSHPFWFQAFGAVMGMDWHSSGITTSVMGALKRGLEPVRDELGLYVCGGRGRHSRKTPAELVAIGERRGLDGDALARHSRLVAKVDSAAVQDGFALYLHSFVVADDGSWAVVQQGMDTEKRQARRYHWLSLGLDDFVDEPHSAIEGPARGRIVNLTDRRARAAREAQLELVCAGPDPVLKTLGALRESPQRGFEESRQPGFEESRQLGFAESHQRGFAESCQPSLAESPQRGLVESRQPGFVESPDLEASPRPRLIMPRHHDVKLSDVVMRRLRGTLAAAADVGPTDFAELLLQPGVGARTVEALALVAEVVHGAPSRFSDPARYAMAHGGKDGHPFPVPLEVFDRTIQVLREGVERAKLGESDRLAAVKRLDLQARALERSADGPEFDAFIAAEKRKVRSLGGRTVFAGKEGAAPRRDDGERPRTPRRPTSRRKGQLELPGFRER